MSSVMFPYILLLLTLPLILCNIVALKDLYERDHYIKKDKNLLNTSTRKQPIFANGWVKRIWRRDLNGGLAYFDDDSEEMDEKSERPNKNFEWACCRIFSSESSCERIVYGSRFVNSQPMKRKLYEETSHEAATDSVTYDSTEKDIESTTQEVYTTEKEHAEFTSIKASTENPSTEETYTFSTTSEETVSIKKDSSSILPVTSTTETPKTSFEDLPVEKSSSITTTTRAPVKLEEHNETLTEGIPAGTEIKTSTPSEVTSTPEAITEKHSQSDVMETTEYIHHSEISGETSTHSPITSTKMSVEPEETEKSDTFYTDKDIGTTIKYETSPEKEISFVISSKPFEVNNSTEDFETSTIHETPFISTHSSITPTTEKEIYDAESNFRTITSSPENFVFQTTVQTVSETTVSNIATEEINLAKTTTIINEVESAVSSETDLPLEVHSSTEKGIAELHTASPDSVPTTLQQDDLEVRFTSLGKHCRHSDDCQGRDPYSYCNNGTCDCMSPDDSCSASSTGCYPDTFQCENGHCISYFFVCDHYKDCEDGSDEDQCIPFKCPKESFQCEDGNCISKSRVCNGEWECPDGSDEARCSTGNPCDENAFRCNNGQCISHYRFCNRLLDCADGSDELDEVCKQGVACPKNSFQCDNKRCGSPAVLCSEIDFCGDNSDEKSCEVCYCPKP